MTWEAFRTAVVAAVVSAMPTAVRAPADNNGPTVTWSDGPRPFAAHRLLLSIVSTTFDHDHDSSLSEGAAQALCSMATVTVQITAESTHDSSANSGGAPGDALWLLEQVRLGLRRISVLDALTTAGVRIVGFPVATISRSYPADHRIISAHSFDVQFRTIFEYDFGGDAEDGGLIERVIGEGEAGGDLADVEFDVSDPTPEP